MNKQQIKNNINDLLSKGEAKKAIDFLLGKTQSRQKEEVIILSNRYIEIRRKQRIGIVTLQEEQLELNRINASLLQITDKLIIENNQKMTQSFKSDHKQELKLPKSNLA
ncbi:MAG: hypothetical protein AB8G86_09820 [Saprospiraceae bacterium]